MLQTQGRDSGMIFVVRPSGSPASPPTQTPKAAPSATRLVGYTFFCGSILAPSNITDEQARRDLSATDSIPWLWSGG